MFFNLQNKMLLIALLLINVVLSVPVDGEQPPVDGKTPPPGDGEQPAVDGKTPPPGDGEEKRPSKPCPGITNEQITNHQMIVFINDMHIGVGLKDVLDKTNSTVPDTMNLSKLTENPADVKILTSKLLMHSLKVLLGKINHLKDLNKNENFEDVEIMKPSDTENKSGKLLGLDKLFSAEKDDKEKGLLSSLIKILN